LRILYIKMGNCCPKAQNVHNETVVKENGTISKKVTNNEIKFWEEMLKTNMIKVSNLTKANVEFNYSNLFIENYMSFTQILDNLVNEENFLYFITIYEMVIAIVDFLQVVFYYKKKHEINHFFLINFDKFYLEKTKSKYYSKLVYLDSKINEHFNCPEI